MLGGGVSAAEEGGYARGGGDGGGEGVGFAWGRGREGGVELVRGEVCSARGGVGAVGCSGLKAGVEMGERGKGKGELRGAEVVSCEGERDKFQVAIVLEEVLSAGDSMGTTECASGKGF